MIDSLRPLMFPITVLTIVSSVYAMAWNKSMDSQVQQAHQPTVLEQEADGDELCQPADRPIDTFDTLQASALD